MYGVGVMLLMRPHMETTEWYELRVEGSAGTQTGIAKGAAEGIAMGENGRLCPLSSGRAMRFKSEREATDYLFQTTISQRYPFAVVRCGGPSKKGP
jgi:hypothetical protein